MALTLDYLAISFSLTLVIIYLVSGRTAIEVNDCGSIASNISYSFSDCNNKNRCSFVVGTNVTMKITFVANNPIKSATIDLAGHFIFIKIPFPVDPPEACGNWGLKCADEFNSEETLEITLPIKWYYPRLNFGVEFKLIDHSGKIIICCTFPAEIVSGS